MAKRKPKKTKPTNQNNLLDWVKALGFALVMAFVIKTSIVEAYSIPSGSMEDTLLIGDYFFANKFLYGARIPLLDVRLPAVRDPEPGDIVIFKKPNDPETYIKRCVAIGGQLVEMRSKILYVDGRQVSDPECAKYVDSLRILPRTQAPRDNFGPVRVPPDHFFMMGDNRDMSYDSRYWGFVDRDMIQGKAMLIAWSWGEDSQAPEWEWSDPISVGKAFFYNTFHFFSRMRWSRSVTVIS